MKSTTGRTIDPDGVDHPAHYNLHPSGVECIDLVRWLNFDVGSAVKYVMRRGEKGDPLKDLRKAEFYLRDFLYEEVGSELERRVDRIDPGRIRSRWHWDHLITHEPDPTAREFYLAIARLDISAAYETVRALVRLESGG